MPTHLRWMVNGLVLCSAFLLCLSTLSTLYIPHSHKHIFPCFFYWRAFYPTFTLWWIHRRETWGSIACPRMSGMQIGAVRHRTTNLPINRWLLQPNLKSASPVTELLSAALWYSSTLLAPLTLHCIYLFAPTEWPVRTAALPCGSKALHRKRDSVHSMAEGLQRLMDGQVPGSAQDEATV